jgi:ankyrin repeat protein
MRNFDWRNKTLLTNKATNNKNMRRILLILIFICLGAHLYHVCALEDAVPSTLLEAVVRNDPQAVLDALDSGEAVDVTNEDGWSAVRMSVELNHFTVLQTLIDRGADLNLPDHDGISPLMVAAAAVSVTYCYSLISFSLTQLHPFNGQADKEMVELLLAHNASPLQSAHDGRTPLTLAEQSGRPLLQYLLAEAAVVRGIDSGDTQEALDGIRAGGYVDMRNGAGWTPLMVAAALGELDAVRELLALGAAANAEEQQGWTALHISAARGHDEVVSLLLQRGGDKAMRTLDGQSPAELAEQQGHRVVVDILDEEL